MSDQDHAKREISWRVVYRDPRVIYSVLVLVLVVVFSGLLLFGGLSSAAFWVLWALVIGASAVHWVLHVRRHRKH